MSRWLLWAIASVFALSVALLIVGVPELVAQPAAKQGAAPAAKPTTAQPAPATPAAPPPPTPQRVETFVQDSWTVTCQEMSGSPKKICSATLQVIDQEKRAVLFSWIIGKTPEGVMTAVFQTPTGVLLQRGLELKIGSATTPRKVNYVACNAQRCEASMPMDDAFIKEASASPTAVATIYLVDGRAANFNLNTKGFDKAVAAIIK